MTSHLVTSMQLPILQYTSPLEAVRSYESSDLDNKDQITAAPQIADMRCSQFYLNIKNTAKGLQNATFPSPSQIILNALYGNDIPTAQSKEKKDMLAGFVIDHCFKEGKKAEQVYDQYMQHQEKHNSVLQPYWRATYKKYISKSTALRRLVLVGLDKNNQPSNSSIKSAISTVKDFAEQIETSKDITD